MFSENDTCRPPRFDIKIGMAFKEALNSFLSGLDETKRNMFVRRYFFADSISDISKSFGIGESNAKVTLMRLRESFKEVLENEEIFI